MSQDEDMELALMVLNLGIFIVGISLILGIFVHDWFFNLVPLSLIPGVISLIYVNYKELKRLLKEGSD